MRSLFSSLINDAQRRTIRGPSGPGRATCGVAAVVPLLAGLALSGCATRPLPVPIQREWVIREVASRYRDFYPTQGDPDPSRDAGLLAPRFGMPSVTQIGMPLTLEFLETDTPGRPRAALIAPAVRQALSLEQLEACARGEPVAGCYALRLDDQTQREPTGAGRSLVRYTARVAMPADPAAAPAPGGYDLFVSAPYDPPVRVPKAVWLRADDPASLQRVRVAHLSDLHVGKGSPKKAAIIHARLQEIISRVNELKPDLVVITGDIVNQGQNMRDQPEARALLEQFEAPLLVILGNHDIEFLAPGKLQRQYGAGWSNFARLFHPFLHFNMQLGGYEFVGFDSGPSEHSLRILTRGLLPASVQTLRDDVERAYTTGRKGVVLFSHAPSRASTFTRVGKRSPGYFGRMRHGQAAFDQVLLDAAARGQQVIHLTGHTHWSDVFEVQRGERGMQFSRWPFKALSACSRTLGSDVAIITTQAASHSGLYAKQNARGYGFSLLTLGEGRPELAVFRYGVAKPAECL